MKKTRGGLNVKHPGIVHASAENVEVRDNPIVSYRGLTLCGATTTYIVLATDRPVNCKRCLRILKAREKHYWLSAKTKGGFSVLGGNRFSCRGPFDA